MGWWRTGEGDDVIGDGPADTITDALVAIAASAGGASGGKPRLAELLGVIDAALRSSRSRILADPETLEGGRIAAQRADGSLVIASEPSWKDEAMEREVLATFEEIALQYLDMEDERYPRLSEMLAAVHLVLGASPGDYVQEGDSVDIQRLVRVPAARS